MGLADKVIPSERDLALAVEKYADEHPDTYVHIARTNAEPSRVVYQVRYDDDNQTIGIEGFFTETKELLDDIHQSQEEIWELTKRSGYENYPGVKTLEEMREFRYNEDGSNYPTKSTPPWGDGTPPWEKDDPLTQDGKERDEKPLPVTSDKTNESSDAK